MQGLPVVQNLVNPAQAGVLLAQAGVLLLRIVRIPIPARLVRAFFYP
jgi:hypothetical protein